MINYHEFVPVAVQVLQGYHARKHAMDHKQKVALPPDPDPTSTSPSPGPAPGAADSFIFPLPAPRTKRMLGSWQWTTYSMA
jgi:hypothetical protein